MKITDASVPGEDKQVALLSACSHSNCGVRKDSSNLGEVMHGDAQRSYESARMMRRGASNGVYLRRIIRKNSTA